jgi:hypothetical protein
MKNCGGLNRSSLPKSSSPNGTPDGHLRHSKFAGLRGDKEAREVVRESS